MKKLLLALVLTYFGAKFIVAQYAQYECLSKFEASYEVTWNLEPWCRTWINGTEKAKPLSELLKKWHQLNSSSGFEASRKL